MHAARRSRRIGRALSPSTSFVALLAIAICWASAALSQEIRYETGPNGERIQVRTQVVQEQVPVTEVRDQQQTIYRPQISTENYQHQQVVTVPVTQYQLVSRIHGRWNPFVTPYWTHHYEPVTTWQRQVATVQLPVSRVAWQPEVRTVQVPITTYRTAEKTVTTRVAMGDVRLPGDARPLSEARALAVTGPPGGASTVAPSTAPAFASATISPSSIPSLAARPEAPIPGLIGGQKLESDPPREGPNGSTTTTNGYGRGRY